MGKERYTHFDLARDVYTESDKSLKKGRKSPPPEIVRKRKPVQKENGKRT